MSSLALPPTIVVSGGINFSSFSNHSSFFGFRPPQVPIARNPNHRHAVSCKTLDDDHQNTHQKHDRRDVLLGLGSLYGAATAFGSNSPAFADPIKPDNCGPPDDAPDNVKPINCCPPFPKEIIDFEFPPLTSNRVRPAAHLVQEEYIAKFSKAIQKMKDLKPEDPRSFMQQAAVHCAYCCGSYKQAGFPGLEVQVHKSWLFLPFHRMYLYFFEKICGKLINDPNFAIPFWNWDYPMGMHIPDMYTHTESPLYDALRDAHHQPPIVVDLDYNMHDKDITPAALVAHNLAIMYRTMITNGEKNTHFMGLEYRAGDPPCPGNGSMETPHDLLHRWTGDRNQTNGEDMGHFYAAARDPIFYGHHANIDRLWSVWKTLPGGQREDFTCNDWLDAYFYFYNEEMKMVRIKVRDCLDTTKLGYEYQDIGPPPWLNSKPTPRRPLRKIKKLGVARANDVFPARLDKAIKVLVPRAPNEKKEEVLVIEGIEAKTNVFVKFDVLVNEEDEGKSGPDKTEFAGSFVNMPSTHKHNPKPGNNCKSKLTLAITELLKDLQAEKDDNVMVTLVPKAGGDAVSIEGIKIEFAR